MLRQLLIGMLLVSVADPPPAPTKESILESVERLAAKHLPSDHDLRALDRQIHELGRQFPQDVATHYWFGVQANRKQDTARALTEWRQVVESQDGSRDGKRWRSLAAYQLAQDRLGRNDVPGAIEWAGRAQSFNPPDPRGWELERDARLRVGGLEALHARLQRARALDPDNPRLRSLDWELMQTTGQTEQLRSAVEARQKIDPLDPDIHRYLAKQAASLDDRLSAFVHYYLTWKQGPAVRDATRKARDVVLRDQTDEKLSEPARGYVRVSRLLESNGVVPTLLEEVKALPIPPAVAECQLLKRRWEAEALLRTADWNGAEPILTSLVRDWPTDSISWALLSEVQRASGNLKGAESSLSQARSLGQGVAAVEQILRMGARFEVVPQGLRVEALEKNSPYEEAGLAVGDTLVALDGRSLATLPPFARLRAATRFQGGRLSYISSKGTPADLSMEIQFFDE